jgi:hypothetical protein
MRRTLLAGAAVTAAALGTMPAQAVTTIFTDGVYTSPYGTAQVIQSFQAAKDVADQQFVAGTVSNNVVSATESRSGNSVFVRNGSIAGVAADPDPANTGGTQYLAVGAGSSYTINFNSPVQFFSFLLGSLDTYNTLTLTFANNGGTSILNGAAIVGKNNSDFTFNSNGNSAVAGRVTYDANGGNGITSATFSSSQAAFEFDAIATAVPEPATWGLMILGVGFAGAQLRTRRRKVTFAAA